MYTLVHFLEKTLKMKEETAKLHERISIPSTSEISS
jgi:hypothetical protein